MYKCNRCKNCYDKYESLSRHMGITHKMNTIQFYVEYNLNGIWPTCKCGCGIKLKWAWDLKSFRDYHQGHQSRIVNNWGHNKKALEHSAHTVNKNMDIYPPRTCPI